MKILFIIPSLVAGGAERQAIYLMRGLLNRGIIVSVLIFDPIGELFDEIPDGIKVYLSKSHKSGNPFRNPLRVLWEIIRVIHKENPDIIYSRHWPTKTPTAFAARLLGKKVVLSEANNLILYMAYNNNGRISSFLKNIACRLADKIVAVSQGVADCLEQLFNINSNIMVIHNGFDLEMIEEKSREETSHPWFKEEEPIVVAVGRLVNQKGFSFLLEAIELANRKTPVRLIIIGDGELKAKLEKQAEEIAIKGKVDFIGVKKNPFAYMARCDLFVLSSVFEGFPNVLVESMALGLPVIATNCLYGPGEIIEDGKNGILVPVKDSRAISEAILRVLEDGELREKLRVAAKRRANVFSLGDMISRHADLFLCLSGKIR
jgi:glycosyltransferase involved in cell wall biosynthesis